MGQPALPGTTTVWPRIRPVAASVALATFVLLAGCGSKDQKGASTGTTPAATTATGVPTLSEGKPSGPPVHWTLVLDYEPNAVHAGLLRAQRAGYFKDEGIDLKIIAPSSTSDALTLVSRGKADLGLADLIDVARRNELAEKAGGASGKTNGNQVMSIAAAVVQHPLSGLLVNAASNITSPDQLAGKKIAVTGLPSDTAVVGAMVAKNGQPLKTNQINLGFDGIKALHAGRVDATTAYWPADSVTLETLGTKARSFALDQFGGPTYPGLVAVSSLKLRVSDPQHVAAFQQALAHGTRDVIADPAEGIDAVQKSYPELDAAITKKQLANYEPLFGTAQTAGQLDLRALDAFTAFAKDHSLTMKRLTVPELDAIPPAQTTP